MHKSLSPLAPRSLRHPPATPLPCSGLDLRPLSRDDFEKVLAQFTPPSRAAQVSRRRFAASGSGNGGAGVPSDTINALLAALAQLAANGGADSGAR